MLNPSANQTLKSRAEVQFILFYIEYVELGKTVLVEYSSKRFNTVVLKKGRDKQAIELEGFHRSADILVDEGKMIVLHFRL